MSADIQTFGYWLRTYCCESSGESLKFKALGELMELAEDPQDATWTKNKDALRAPRWKIIFDFCPLGSEAQEEAGPAILRLLARKKRDMDAKRQEAEEMIARRIAKESQNQ